MMSKYAIVDVVWGIVVINVYKRLLFFYKNAFFNVFIFSTFLF